MFQQVKIPSGLKQAGLFFMALLLLSSCSYKDRVAPISLPDNSSNMVVVGDGLKISATAFVDPDQAQGVFGFNVRKAGLLPVQLTLQNDGSTKAQILADQTFLVDQQNNAWPVATQERTYQRTKKYVDVGETLKSAAKPSLLMGAAGAVAGLAIGIVTGENIGESMGKGAVLGGAAGAVVGGAKGHGDVEEKLREDLYTKSMKNSPILPGQIAYGVLYFPGMPEEAQSARELRLHIDIGGKSQVVKIYL